MLRTILLLLIAVLYLILTLPVLLVITLIGRKHPEVRDRVATAMIRWIFRVLGAGAGAHVTVRGIEKIPRDTAVLYVGNHRSIFDIILVHPYTVGRTGFVAKNSLGRVPVFSIWCRYIGCLFFDRDNMREAMQMIRDGVELLEQGTSVFIFPEGTRSREASDLPLLPFHEGSFRIATRNNRPVVPIAISNTAAIFERQMPFVRSRSVTIEFCDPIDPSTLTRDEKKKLGARARDVITETIRRNESLPA